MRNQKLALEEENKHAKDEIEFHMKSLCNEKEKTKQLESRLRDVIFH